MGDFFPIIPLYKDHLFTAKTLYFNLVGQVLCMTKVHLLVLAADRHLTTGGWGVGYMGARLADEAPPNPPIANTGYVTACRLGCHRNHNNETSV